MSECAAGVLVMLGAKNMKTLYEIEHPTPEDNRSTGEIINDITARAGLRVVKKRECISLDGDAGA